MFWWIIPISKLVTRRHAISSKSIVCIRDPKTGWRLIRVQQRKRTMHQRNDIIGERVVHFNTIFDEHSVSKNVVRNVALNGKVVTPMSSQRTIKGMMHGTSHHVTQRLACTLHFWIGRFRQTVLEHLLVGSVIVNGVSSELKSLTNIRPKFNVFKHHLS